MLNVNSCLGYFGFSEVPSLWTSNCTPSLSSWLSSSTWPVLSLFMALFFSKVLFTVWHIYLFIVCFPSIEYKILEGRDYLFYLLLYLLCLKICSRHSVNIFLEEWANKWTFGGRSPIMESRCVFICCNPKISSCWLLSKYPQLVPLKHCSWQVKVQLLPKSSFYTLGDD